MGRVTLEELEEVFGNYTPQEREAHDRIPSAVLVPIIRKGDELCLLFMRKVEDGSHHSGQVSFPGGAYEEEDRDLLATALRETHEEVGIPPRAWRILGKLDTVKTRGTPYVIHPFVGVLEEKVPLKPNPQEVARVFNVPLKYILEHHPFQTKPLVWKGKTYHTFTIPYQGETIWGATARILDIMCRIIKGIPTASVEGPRKGEQR